jgi:hypothetical protein
LVKVPALEESVHFRLRSSALSFDRFANDYAVSKQFAPEPLGEPSVRPSAITGAEDWYHGDRSGCSCHICYPPALRKCPRRSVVPAASISVSSPRANYVGPASASASAMTPTVRLSF